MFKDGSCLDSAPGNSKKALASLIKKAAEYENAPVSFKSAESDQFDAAVECDKENGSVLKPK
eukprot:PDM65701.1 hypothetical protein PRIPAC_45615 [Pristionchus pacificus]